MGASPEPPRELRLLIIQEIGPFSELQYQTTAQWTWLIDTKRTSDVGQSGYEHLTPVLSVLAFWEQPCLWSIYASEGLVEGEHVGSALSGSLFVQSYNNWIQRP